MFLAIHVTSVEHSWLPCVGSLSVQTDSPDDVSHCILKFSPKGTPRVYAKESISQPLFSPPGPKTAVRCPSEMIVLKTLKHFPPAEPFLKSAFCMHTHRQESVYSLWLLPGYNRHGWLGVNHQLTYLLTLPLLLLLSGGGGDDDDNDDDDRKKSRHIVMFKMAWRKLRRKRRKHN